MVLAGIVGFEESLLSFGDATISLVYGIATLGIGAVPFYLVAIAILRVSRAVLTLARIVTCGLILGAVFQPILPILGSFIKELPIWRSFENTSQVGIGLGVVGLFCTVVAALIVAGYSILTSPARRSDASSTSQ
jgi:hypothetical protein